MMALPTGTVTFLFTDIEGSTRLLHALASVTEPCRIVTEIVRLRSTPRMATWSGPSVTRSS